MSQTTRQSYPDFCGQPVCDEEMALIREVIDSCGLSRKELASTVCELLNWTRPSGRLKTYECTKYLERVAIAGLLPSLGECPV